MGQFAIIGIGNFGYYLGRHLFDKGHEVIALDLNRAQVEKIKDFVSQAVAADASERETLAALGLKDVDAAVVCIGTNMHAAVLATLHLKELKIRRILVKANSEEQGRILSKIGADEIIFPERDQAITVASRLDNPSVLDYLPFVEGYSIAGLAPPPDFIGKTLKDLDLINRYGLQVLAVKELIPPRITMIPTGAFLIKDSDSLIVLGPDNALKKFHRQDRR